MCKGTCSYTSVCFEDEQIDHGTRKHSHKGFGGMQGFCPNSIPNDQGSYTEEQVRAQGVPVKRFKGVSRFDGRRIFCSKKYMYDCKYLHCTWCVPLYHYGCPAIYLSNHISMPSSDHRITCSIHTSDAEGRCPDQI